MAILLNLVKVVAVCSIKTTSYMYILYVEVGNKFIISTGPRVWWYVQRRDYLNFSCSECACQHLSMRIVVIEPMPFLFLVLPLNIYVVQAGRLCRGPCLLGRCHGRCFCGQLRIHRHYNTDDTFQRMPKLVAKKSMQICWKCAKRKT